LPEEIRGYAKGGAQRLDDNASLSNLERQHIINTLSRLNGNKSRGAKALGISLKTLYNKLKTYDIPN
jgi:DNA-binding NtrC family response regulator